MMKKIIAVVFFAFCVIVSCLALKDSKSIDPLTKANAYSLEMDENLKTSEDFFPVGMLVGSNSFDIIPQIGFNLTEMHFTYYAFKDNRKCNLKFRNSLRGKCYFNIWAAHTLYNSRKTKQFGMLKNSIKDNGKPASHHYINYSDPQTRKYILACAASTTKEIVKYKNDSILLWGIDNEWEPPLDYSDEAIKKFHNFLRQSYSNKLDVFNKAWQSSHKSFDEAVPPKISEYKDKPAAWLDWRCFQEEIYTDFIRDYFGAIQSNDPEKRPVTSKSTQCSLEMPAVAKKRVNNHEMLAKKVRLYGKGWYAIDLYGHGDRNNYEINYLYNCALPVNKKDDFKTRLFATETNNHSGTGCQFAQTYWRTLANGLKAVNFFVLGGYGAKHDCSTFGFTYPNGKRRDKFYYASRFASLIHRNEKFWTNCTPAAVKKIAILLPQRDIQLSGDTGLSWWDYPINNRLKVFSWLREIGYWVDIIPYSKLTPEFMQRYKGLFLINAEHLSSEECEHIKDFVKKGGILVADTRPGYYDEHHLARNGLKDLLGLEIKGVYTGKDVSPDDMWYNSKYGNVIRADGKILAKLKSAKLLNIEDTKKNAKCGWLTCNEFGKGKALWFNTRLGALRPEQVDEKYIAEWLADILKEHGLPPHYAIKGERNDSIRIETPQVDSNGNCAIVIAGNKACPSKPFEATISLSQKTGKNLYWAPAETTWLEKIEVVRNNQNIIFKTPNIRSSGVLYSFINSEPFLGISITPGNKHAEFDRWTPKFNAGDTFTTKIQLINPSPNTLPPGTIKLSTLQDWQVITSEVKTPALKPGSQYYCSIKVRIPTLSDKFRYNSVYPLVATWNDGKKNRAICNAICEVEPDPTTCTYRLSDNPGEADFIIHTGITYDFPAEQKNYIKDPLVFNKKRGSAGRALVNGLSWRSKQVYFDRQIRNTAVTFDLKKEYIISKLRFAKGAKPYPTNCQIFTSIDGVKFNKLTEPQKFDWKDKKWFTITFKDDSARYVKIALNFKSGGFLDEIEIYGNRINK